MSSGDGWTIKLGARCAGMGCISAAINAAVRPPAADWVFNSLLKDMLAMVPDGSPQPEVTSLKKSVSTGDPIVQPSAAMMDEEPDQPVTVQAGLDGAPADQWAIPTLQNQPATLAEVTNSNPAEATGDDQLLSSLNQAAVQENEGVEIRMVQGTHGMEPVVLTHQPGPICINPLGSQFSQNTLGVDLSKAQTVSIQSIEQDTHPDLEAPRDQSNPKKEFVLAPAGIDALEAPGLIALEEGNQAAPGLTPSSFAQVREQSTVQPGKGQMKESQRKIITDRPKATITTQPEQEAAPGLTLASLVQPAMAQFNEPSTDQPAAAVTQQTEQPTPSLEQIEPAKHKGQLAFEPVPPALPSTDPADLGDASKNQPKTIAAAQPDQKPAPEFVSFAQAQSKANAVPELNPSPLAPTSAPPLAKTSAPTPTPTLAPPPTTTSAPPLALTLTPPDIVQLSEAPKYQPEATVISLPEQNITPGATQASQAQSKEESLPISPEKKVIRPNLTDVPRVMITTASQPAATDLVVQKPTAPVQVESGMLEQITTFVQQSDSQEQTSLRLHLKPAELGGIEIRLVKGPNGVEITVLAEKAATGRMLEAQSQQLQQTIVDAGVPLSQLLIGQNAGASPQANLQSQQGQSQPETKRSSTRVKKQIDSAHAPKKEAPRNLIDYRM
jgi:flagellar hook-length control protein FliK